MVSLNLFDISFQQWLATMLSSEILLPRSLQGLVEVCTVTSQPIIFGLIFTALIPLFHMNVGNKNALIVIQCCTSDHFYCSIKRILAWMLFSDSVIVVVEKLLPFKSRYLLVSASFRRRHVFESLRLQANTGSWKVTTFPLKRILLLYLYLEFNSMSLKTRYGPRRW